MEDGFFILVFIAIAVIQGIGQKRRKDAKQKNQPMGAPPRPSTRPPQRASQQPAQQPDTRPRADPEVRPSPSGTAEAGGSEGLIPSDIWQEILGLARGTTQTPGPGTAPPGSAEGPQERPRSLEASPGDGDPTPGGRSPEPPVRELQIRPRSPETIRQPSPAALKRQEAAAASLALPATASSAGATRTPASGERGREGRDARAQLFGEGSVEELRKAIILKEVLGPPLALRDEVG